jgi:RNA polymerase sigma factor (sigma-70 family)
MQDAADMELLGRYAHEDSEAAFAVLVTRHANLVYSVGLRKTGDAHAAQEITQAVFIVLARKAGGLRRDTVLSGWLCETARLIAANYLRTERRRIHREQEAVMESLSHSPESDIWPHMKPLLDDAIGKMSRKERDAVVLRFFEGKSFQEIGTVFGASENAAKKRVQYALEKLRKFFARRGVVSTTTVIAGLLSAHAIQAAPSGVATSAIAAATGSAASFSTFALVNGVLKVMAWTKAKTGLVAAVIVAAVITPIAWQQRTIHQLRDELKRARVQAQSSSALAAATTLASRPRIVTNFITKAFDWRQVESPDYRQYIANLHATGCPEETIRDIIVADVDKLFATRRNEFISKSKRWEYWREEPETGTVDVDTSEKLEQLVNDKRELCKELLGSEPKEMPDLLAESMRNQLEAMFNYLPDDKRRIVLDLLLKHQPKKSEESSDGVQQDPLDQEKKLKQAMERELAEFLSSEELEEWQLRTSDLTAGLRRQLKTFKPDEQEFRKIFKLQSAFEAEWGRSRPTGPPRLEAYNTARSQFLASVKDALGESRYESYLKATQTN